MFEYIYTERASDGERDNAISFMKLIKILNFEVLHGEFRFFFFNLF